ncbi:uncharacterized protein LOC122069809 isoform X2 [Macadamia integrifolia]|uniref:uncharacterized protein LOC122069809 isoform X2 n=1 Tax=Macadamia integrifolia TaxID=60698 RepID=UPI001C4E3F0D|nr:uncharacterized protein LOC122069809 isoform X2 [Macadamia integrifolia]
MEYERIDKVQMGIISPSKLRLKLIGSSHQKKKDGTNNNSSRTSPARLDDDAEFLKNNLLATKNGDFDNEGGSKDSSEPSVHSVAPSINSSSVKAYGEGMSNSGHGYQTGSRQKDILSKEIGDMGHMKIQHLSKGISGNFSTVHPVKSQEEDSPDHENNSNSSNFEFHKGEKSLHNPMVRPFSRSIPSKWNDAEKWLVNKQPLHTNHSKKMILQSQVNRKTTANLGKVVPEFNNSEQKASVIPVVDSKQIDSHHSASQAANAAIDLCPLGKDEKEMNRKELSDPWQFTTNTTDIPNIRSVAMRDMGTEMTPVTSQEPSRTTTPVGATTPLRSPTSSIPSTPRRGAPASTPLDFNTDNDAEHQKEDNKKQLSEQELKIKTRKEIVALGVQLGKTNIAAWASKYDTEKNAPSVEHIDAEEQIKIEYENRAAAWEEAEKTKHTARYKREEIKIQAWESQQKARIEAEIRRIEAQAEHIRSHGQEKMMKKIAIARQRSEGKRAAAEARRNRQAARTAAQADYIRQTGRIPPSHFICCTWAS